MSRRLLLTVALFAASVLGQYAAAQAAGSCPGCHYYGARQHYSGRTGYYGVPAGRTYYNGKYFGNFNNRFYGPQYGYF